MTTPGTTPDTTPGPIDSPLRPPSEPFRFAGVAFARRQASASEHKRFDELLVESGLENDVLEAEVKRIQPPGPTLREDALLDMQQRLGEDIKARLETASTPEERAEVLRLADEFDELQLERDRIALERTKNVLRNQERVVRLNDHVYARFVWEILSERHGEVRPFEEFEASLTPADLDVLADVITSLGVRIPLSRTLGVIRAVARGMSSKLPPTLPASPRPNGAPSPD